MLTRSAQSHYRIRSPTWPPSPTQGPEKGGADAGRLPGSLVLVRM
jgi:hypothetical protein